MLNRNLGTRRRFRQAVALVLVFAAIGAMNAGIPTARAAPVQVAATVETDPVSSSGDAADDPAIWIHPTDPALSTIIGTDKTATGGLVVYDLSGQRLFFYADGRYNNVDVAYNFPLGSERVALVATTNRAMRRIDFYKVDPADRSLKRIGAVATTSAIVTPRGIALYHSPVTGKFHAFVTDVGKTDQYELSGESGSVTGRVVRQWTLPNPTEGLVADHELQRVYLAEENIGGVWRYGAEPGDSTVGVKVDSTTERGGHIVQDVKGLTLYYGAGGKGYLIAASQGGNSFHLYRRDDNAYVGEFKIVAGGGVDGVTGEDGIDVTNFGLGPRFPEGLFISQDHSNEGGGNQNFKVVPWPAIARAFSPGLLIDPTWDPRLVGGADGGDDAPETTITSGPTGTVDDRAATFEFASTDAAATFECALDAAGYSACSSPTTYSALTEGPHTFAVRAVDDAGHVDPSPASRSWTIDVTAPSTTTLSPSHGATGVATTADVRAAFSEAMDPATLNTTSFTLARAGASVLATVAYDAATRVATLRPGAPLEPDTSYTARVTTDARDVAGNALATEAVWSFTTAARPASTGIVRESTSTRASTAAATTVTIPRPAGTAAGDVLVACLTLNGGAVAASGAPAGWTRIAAVTTVGNPHVFGYYKVAGSLEPADYRWTLTSSVTSGAGIARYSGVDGVSPLDGTPRTASGPAALTGTLTSPAPAAPGALAVGCMGINSSSTAITISSPAGMTEAWDLGGKRHELADGLAAAGDKAWRFSAAREWAGWLTALRPR